MLRWLLKYEGYPPGVVFAVLMHGILILFLIGRQFDAKDLVPAEKPVFITATLIQDNPQQQRTEQRRVAERQQEAQRQREQQRQAEAEKQRQADAEKQRQETAAAKQREADAQKQRQAEAEKQAQAEAEKQRQAEVQKQRQAEAEKLAAAEKQRQADAEKQRQAEAEKQRQAAAEKQRQQQEEAARQATAAAAAQADAAATNLVSQYVALISDLVGQNWTRPPNATNGMTAVVEIRMTPTGEIVSSNIIKSSGDAAFDRSVDQAVKRLGRIPEMQDLPNAVFERYFRGFSLTFTPEDLLR